MLFDILEKNKQHNDQREVIRIHILEKNKQHNDQREVIRIHILEKNKQHNDQREVIRIHILGLFFSNIWILIPPFDHYVVCSSPIYGF
jgi:hypothetical protein